MVITVIGTDPIMAVPRFDFGTSFLRNGFQFLPVLIGIFAFAQIMTELERMATGGAVQAIRAPNLTVSHTAVVWEILSRPFLLLWSTIVGLLIGVLPAIGGSAANVMAYDQAKKFSRHPEKFGTGIPEGIIASESSNNSNVAGSLVTIMAFGIPGDAVTAVMLGAMTIHGIQPGPLFISQQPKVAYGLFAAYILAHPIMMVLQWLLARVYLRIVRVPKAILFPQILVLCVIGAYALNNVMDNVYALLLFGVVGYGLVKFGFPLAPLILGVILGDQIEVNLVRALMTDSDPLMFVTRPISGVMLGLAVASVVFALWQHRRQYGKGATPSEPETDF
jgi:putative tricarboxylic transport membrane protein